MSSMAPTPSRPTLITVARTSEPREPHPEERLQKILARVGFGSRRVCEEIIAEGRVTVDGVVAELGKRVDVETQVVAVDGAPVGVRPDLVYYLLNKPAGVITTADDPQVGHRRRCGAR